MSFLSKPPAKPKCSPNALGGALSKKLYESPMVPIKEDRSDADAECSFSIMKSLLPVPPPRPAGHIEVSSFGDCGVAKSPGFISNFSTSKCTLEHKPSGSKYTYELDDESQSSSDECLSYEEGRSENSYCDIYVDNISKQSLANLRRKSAYLIRAPVKPSTSHQFSDADSDHSDDHPPKVIQAGQLYVTPRCSVYLGFFYAPTVCSRDERRLPMLWRQVCDRCCIGLQGA